MTRRQVLELLGIGAAGAAFPGQAHAQAASVPKGAVIRTVLRDYAPEELASGATLFHEHMSLGPDFNAKFSAASAAARALNGPPPAPLGGSATSAAPPRGAGPAGPPAAGAGRGTAPGAPAP